MPKLPTPPRPAREYSIRVRLSQQEAERIAANAAAEHLSVSQYVRTRCL